jgi:fumarylacetoacetate (FAA) hydrolase family protein
MATNWDAHIDEFLPEDGCAGTLVGRIWRPDVGGPSVVSIRKGGVVDITTAVPTMSALTNADDPVALAASDGEGLGDWRAIAANSVAENRDPAKPWFLSPADLHAHKACGVTFVRSLLERVIDERTSGDPALAEEVRKELLDSIGIDLSDVIPGSDESEKVKNALLERDMWSQYLEVGIGPYAEVFSKAQPMSSVGFGAAIGIHPMSTWNNPEPEVVLVGNAIGQIVGAALGNDVNLRDVEGRSALLLGRAKDNNGSCAIGPIVRLIDHTYTLDNIRSSYVSLTVAGTDNFRLEDGSSMTEISRDIEDLMGQTLNANHQYPDGVMLFTGTMFTPNQDRDRPGGGFTHHVGDTVVMQSPKLGTLANTVDRTDAIPAWEFGSTALFRNLAKRGVL